MDRDWKDARVDRLAERVDKIENERREEKWRAQDRWMYFMLALLWIAVIATVALAAVKAGTR